MLNRKGQIADTMVWLVATIIIVIVLLFSLFISQSLFGDKGISDLNIDNLIVQKSLSSYVLKVGKSDLAMEKLHVADDEGLALRVFGDESKIIWVGFIDSGEYVSNDYFGKNPRDDSLPRGSSLVGGETIASDPYRHVLRAGRIIEVDVKK